MSVLFFSEHIVQSKCQTKIMPGHHLLLLHTDIKTSVKLHIPSAKYIWACSTVFIFKYFLLYLNIRFTEPLHKTSPLKLYLKIKGKTKMLIVGCLIATHCYLIKSPTYKGIHI